MNAVLGQRLSIVWLILSALTIIYIGVDRSTDHNGIRTASAAVTIMAILISAVKVRIIFYEFMDVRHAPKLLRRLTDLWVAIIIIGPTTAYLVGTWIAHH